MNNKLNPGAILRISGAYWETCALHAAVKLDVFTPLDDGSATAIELAERLETDARATEMLLNAITAMGLLIKTDGRYTNSLAGKAFLSKRAPGYIGYMIMHHHHLVESWFQLDKAVRSGHRVRDRSSFSDAEWRESFLMGMFNNAMGIAPGLSKELDLGERRHLLDLGGGPGTYAIHFCLEKPDLRATVYDLPSTRPFAEKTISRFNVEDRISFQSGDYLEEEIDGRFDVAWLSHILHAESPEDCSRIIQKAVNVLEPGGLILIHEFILDDTMDGPLFPALFSLNMLLGTDSGQSYAEKDLIRMLTETGVTNIRRLPFKGPTESGILMGEIS